MLNGIQVGETLARKEVHRLFGGRQQGGISPSRVAPVVMFFTDPVTGHQHGYYDGMDEDGLFNYVGEGQRSDQQFVQGNKAILRHGDEGRSLEGFWAQGSSVTYLGEFELVDHYKRDAHETGDKSTIRQVIVFRLRPKGPLPVTLPRTPVTKERHTQTEEVPIEEQHTERTFVTPDREPYELERAEARLVQRYRRHLEGLGRYVTRLRIVPPGEGAPIYTDLWDKDERDLVEAKGSVTRNSIRFAVGQLLDYNRFVDAATLTILVPERPRTDLMEFLGTVGIGAVYPNGNGWERA